uniref:Uncharacterized protein n=1 Tax=Arundo donax TaxID=35708 RepID=A0A0A9A1N0_ARUDO
MIDTAQTTIIHILEDLASLLDLCTGSTVAAALSTVFFLATSMAPTSALLLILDDSCVTLSILLEAEMWSILLDVLRMVSSRGQFLRLWCRYRALFKALPHSMLRRSLSRASRSSFMTVAGSGGSGNLAQHVFTTSVFLQSALSKLQLPTPNLSP